jgi:aspartyl-tRNA(Asn)/glutamyl-tRNA(Gln) amidotransferase subunit C
MAFTQNELANIMQLAYLNSDLDNTHQLAKDVKAIMDFVEQLRKIDTTGIFPLFHPLDLQQRGRIDEISEKDSSAQLAKIAPHFADRLYLVPKVIDTGQ